ncbi:hypothetical protein K2P56_04775 [Patescibacteria group bacterium]|nr:hypothetical protein [Patescibacteria group bacterium]
MPKVLIFASGSREGGGSGFQNLVEWSRANVGSFEIVGVVSNNENGGVRQKADALGVSFTYFAGPFEAEQYQKIARESGADFFALSGWLKMVKGLDAKKTFNIHPGLLSVLGGRLGGENMWGARVLDATYEALQKGEMSEFGVSMHFVTDEYDRGPVFFEYRIPYRAGMTKEEVGEATHKAEHEWQPKITRMVVSGEISWDGVNPKSVTVPAGYEFLPK